MAPYPITDAVLPGLAYFLENFTPYKDYVKKLRQIEDEFQKKSDVSRHAFYKLRFGGTRAPLELTSQVNSVFEEIVQELMDVKKFDPLLENDIGMRGVMYALGEFKPYLDKHRGKTLSWKEYCTWFAKAMDPICSENWFKGYDGKKCAARDLLTHVAYDHAGTIVNYRLEHAQIAFGNVLFALVCCYACSEKGKVEDGEWEDIWEECADVLYDRVFIGYKKQVRPDLRPQYPEGGKPLNDAVKSEAKRLATKHRSRFLRHLTKYKEICGGLN